MKKSDEEFEEYFEFELAPYPLSLFDEKGMRKSKKSSFHDFIITTLYAVSVSKFRNWINYDISFSQNL